MATKKKVDYNRNPDGNPAFKAMPKDKEQRDKGFSMAMALVQMPQIDLNDLDALNYRIAEYFSLCQELEVKPAMNGFAQCLGLTRQELYNVANNVPVSTKTPKFTTSRARNISPESTDVIKNAVKTFETMWEVWFANGDIAPVPGIFLAKNHFGYKDQVEQVVVPVNPLGEVNDPKEIAERIQANLPEAKKELPNPDYEIDSD